MAYSTKVLDHYSKPAERGELQPGGPARRDRPGRRAGVRDVLKLQIFVNPDTGVIEDAKFKTFGCGSAIASSSLATEWLKGKTIDEALAIKNTEIVEELYAAPAGEGPLLGPGRGRDQGGDQELPAEATGRVERGWRAV